MTNYYPRLSTPPYGTDLTLSTLQAPESRTQAGGGCGVRPQGSVSGTAGSKPERTTRSDTHTTHLREICHGGVTTE